MRIPAPADSVFRCHVALVVVKQLNCFNLFATSLPLNYRSNFLLLHPWAHSQRILRRRSKKPIHPSRPSPWTNRNSSCPHTSRRRRTTTYEIAEVARTRKFTFFKAADVANIHWSGKVSIGSCPSADLVLRLSHSAHAILLRRLLLTLQIHRGSTNTVVEDSWIYCVQFCQGTFSPVWREISQLCIQNWKILLKIQKKIKTQHKMCSSVDLSRSAPVTPA